MGTRLQIAIQETQEAAHVLADALIALGHAISEALRSAWKCMSNLIRPAIQFPTMSPVKKDNSKRIDRIARAAEARQRFQKGGHWV